MTRASLWALVWAAQVVVVAGCGAAGPGPADVPPESDADAGAVDVVDPVGSDGPVDVADDVAIAHDGVSAPDALDGGSHLDADADADTQPVADIALLDALEVDAAQPPGCVDDLACAGVAAGPCELSVCDPQTGECVTGPAPDGSPCDDDNACSATDGCAAGQCVGLGLLACDDGNPCTDDGCDPASGCTTSFNFAPCDNGDPCSAGDACAGGVCLAGAPACDDGNPCTVDACDTVTGGCHFTPLTGTPCDDGSPCTAGDQCIGGVCEAGTADGCDDGNACTLDACGDAATCEYTALDSVPCDDGDACTLGESCSDGACLGAVTIACDDQDPCTVDSCHPSLGCLYDPTPGAPCEDGDVCTGDASCAPGGACVSASFVDCDDANPCTKDSCHPLNGCTHIVKIGPCDDGDACTDDDACLGQVCVGAPLACDDDDACTIDSCDPLIGCQAVDVSATCHDGDPCTDDGCSPATGCAFSTNTAPCHDGDACTTDDSCQQGECTGAALACDDGDPCTLDACDHEEGCLHEPWFGPCEDGDACTTGETCSAEGLCGAGLPVDPADGFACTMDSCEPAVGPVHTPDDGLCGVGQFCAVAAGCATGDVRLLISKVLLWPTEDEPMDGDGQWVAIANVGALPIDLRLLELETSTGEAATLHPLDAPDEPLILAPGTTLAGAEPELTAAQPGSFSFAIGSLGDGWVIDPTGDTLLLVDAAGVALDTLDFHPVTHGPAVPPGAFPIIPGAPTELAAAALATAKDQTGNDIADQWCVQAEASASPEGPALVCSRLRLNEISVATTTTKRWVELHAPSGARFDGSQLHLVGGDGASLGLVSVPSGRAPIILRTVLTDGLAAVDLPPMTDGSVQLVRLGDLLDVYGFGDIEVTVDATLGHPLYEVAPGPAQISGFSAARLPDGSDTDDATEDWVEVEGGSPGKSNDPE